MTAHDDDARRAYWSRQMDAAYAFMQQAAACRVADCGERFVHLPDAVADANIEATFSTTPVIDGVERLFYLREGLIDDFLAACRDMNARGWAMKVEDGYRTIAIQKGLARKPSVFDAVLRTVLWECGGARPDVKFMARRVAALIAYCPKVGTHTSCSAIDISVYDRTTGKEIDRGAPYIEMSAKTPMDSPFVSDEARRNREAITGIMRRHGFEPYPFEFWHYNKDDAYTAVLHRSGKPAKYGPVHWDAGTNTVTPIADPCAPLNSDLEIEASIEAALTRIAPGK